ncbi:MAG: ORF6N domain-containing protein [Oscillospiraceae bacterium]|nr:ORF6N domain-containing protein [Oscillospiraceae bacterium]
MNELIKFEEVEKRVLIIRDQHMLLDKDVAELYGVETKDINRAVRNNPGKFPNEYIVTLNKEEWDSLRLTFLTLDASGRGQHTKYAPKAFTEKGLYMLATILKSSAATQTTIAIVETFAKMREFARIVTQLPDIKEETEKNALMQRGGDLFMDVLEDNILEVTGDEISLELDLSILKIKRTVKREKKKPNGFESK